MKLPFRADAIKTVSKQLQEEGEFAYEDAPHSLLLHLTAVSRYENQEATEKVKRHMKNFKALLEQQLENECISENAYNRLQTEADSLIDKSD